MTNTLTPPGIVTANEVAKMDEFRQLIEGFNKNTEGMTASTAAPTQRAGIAPPAFSQGAAVRGSAEADPAMNDFTKLVGNLYGNAADHAAQTLTESINPEIKEALETTKTTSGVRIGKWEIVSRKEKYNLKEEKVFDIVRPSTKEKIADSLSVYECAHALVRYLNKGYPINGSEISKILQLEEKFFSYREDAKLFKIRAISAKRKGDQNKANIMEDRFDYARDNALSIKKQIMVANKKSLRS